MEGASHPLRVRLVDAPSDIAPQAGTAAPISVERPSPPPVAVKAALDTLDLSPTRVKLGAYAKLRDIDRPGLYSWWVDEGGARQLAEGLMVPVSPGRIYIGQAGATLWPSGKRRDARLRDRISLMHLGNKISFSTLRLTFASCLRSHLSLSITGAKLLAPASEASLSAWMKEHLDIAAFGYDDVDSLDELEQEVLRSLDPPFNLKHMPPSALRGRLRKLRSAVSTGS